jgi:hypothetical protein
MASRRWNAADGSAMSDQDQVHLLLCRERQPIVSGPLSTS